MTLRRLVADKQSMRGLAATIRREWQAAGAVAAAALLALSVARIALAASPEVTPTTVSMRLRDVPAREAYAELARLSKVNVRYEWGQPSSDARVSMSLIQEPFWKALAQINKSAKMQVTWVRRDNGNDVLLIPTNAADDGPLATSVDGLFLGAITQYIAPDDRRLVDDRAAAIATNVNLQIRAEPKIRAMLWHSWKVEEISDEFGRPIEARQGSRTSLFSDGVAHAVVAMPPRAWPRKIGRLRVSGRVMAGVKSETAEIKHLMLETPPVVQAGGFRIETRTTASKTGRMLTLNMTRLGTSGLDWLRPASRLALLEPIVTDKKGGRFSVLPHDRDWLGRVCRLSLEARDPRPNRGKLALGEPDKLVMEIPTEVVEYGVTFEFSNVSLR